MLIALFGCVLLVTSFLLWHDAGFAHLTRVVSDIRLRWESWYLRSTRVTLDPRMAEQVVSVNDHLRLIRHASGHVAFLPVACPPPAHRPLPPALRSLLLLFFSL